MIGRIGRLQSYLVCEKRDQSVARANKQRTEVHDNNNASQPSDPIFANGKCVSSICFHGKMIFYSPNSKHCTKCEVPDKILLQMHSMRAYSPSNRKARAMTSQIVNLWREHRLFVVCAPVPASPIHKWWKMLLPSTGGNGKNGFHKRVSTLCVWKIHSECKYPPHPCIIYLFFISHWPVFSATNRKLNRSTHRPSITIKRAK